MEDAVDVSQSYSRLLPTVAVDVGYGYGVVDSAVVGWNWYGDRETLG